MHTHTHTHDNFNRRAQNKSNYTNYKFKTQKVTIPGNDYNGENVKKCKVLPQPSGP